MPIKPEALETLRKRREKISSCLSPEKLTALHEKGMLSARERIDNLFEEGTFQEIGMHARHNAVHFGMEGKELPADGVITGTGYVDKKQVAAFCQDFSVQAGTLGKMQARKIVRLMRNAIKNGVPVVAFKDSGGARIQEGVDALSGYGDVFYSNVLLSGVVPQIAVVLGPCAGGAAYSPALMDFVIMTRKNAHMFLTGPEVIKAVTGEQVSAQDLGGAEVHTGRSGVAHLAAETEIEGLAMTKLLLSYLPQNNNEEPPQITPEDPVNRMEESLNELIPDGENNPYDIRDAIEAIFDQDSFFEIQADYAANAVIGFARLDGYSIGVVANQPAFMSGALNIDASDKIARFIRVCDAFNVPIVTFVDCPGFLPGTSQEYSGIIRHGAKIIYAYCEATVPKISIVTRKAMGGAYVAMGSKQMRNDITFAWPSAQIAVMGAGAAVNVLFREEIKNAADPVAREKELMTEYRDKFFNPYRAADVGQIDEVIEPRETRPRLARALEILRTKIQQNPPKKHGLCPV